MGGAEDDLRADEGVDGGRLGSMAGREEIGGGRGGAREVQEENEDRGRQKLSAVTSWRMRSMSNRRGKFHGRRLGLALARVEPRRRGAGRRMAE